MSGGRVLSPCEFFPLTLLCFPRIQFGMPLQAMTELIAHDATYDCPDEIPRRILKWKFDDRIFNGYLSKGVPMDPAEMHLMKMKKEKTEEEKKRLRLAEVNVAYENTVKVYSAWTDLYILAYNIRVCLSEGRPFFKKAIECLERISEIPLTPIVILRTPILVFEMIRCTGFTCEDRVTDIEEEARDNYVRRIKDLANRNLLNILEVLQVEITPSWPLEAMRVIARFYELTFCFSAVQMMLVASPEDLIMNRSITFQNYEDFNWILYFHHQVASGLVYQTG